MGPIDVSVLFGCRVVLIASVLVIGTGVEVSTVVLLFIIVVVVGTKTGNQAEKNTYALLFLKGCEGSVSYKCLRMLRRCYG